MDTFSSNSLGSVIAEQKAMMQVGIMLYQIETGIEKPVVTRHFISNTSVEVRCDGVIVAYLTYPKLTGDKFSFQHYLYSKESTQWLSKIFTAPSCSKPKPAQK